MSATEEIKVSIVEDGLKITVKVEDARRCTQDGEIRVTESGEVRTVE